MRRLSSATWMNSPGAHDAARGMTPADERLHRGDLAGDEVDDRLVVEDELLLLHRELELAAQLAPVHDVALHARREEHVAVASRTFRGVHRNVGMTHEARRVIGNIVCNSDAE